MFGKQVVTDPGCEYCSPNKVREMVTHWCTHLFIKDNSNVRIILLKCV